VEVYQTESCQSTRKQNGKPEPLSQSPLWKNESSNRETVAGHLPQKIKSKQCIKENKGEVENGKEQRKMT